MIAEGCAAHVVEIIAAIRTGSVPAAPTVPQGELRGVPFKAWSALRGGAERAVWRIRCEACPWFDCQWTRAEAKATYAGHLAHEHKEAAA